MLVTACHPFKMPKRLCPFSDDMKPQVKIHVREKEVAKGVMSDRHMKLVYDKTKNLLFSGAKKTGAVSALELNTCQSDSTIKPDSLPNCGSLKQMQLTLKGQLSAPNDFQVLYLKKAPCSMCAVWNTSEMCSCSFCDTSLCGSCTQVCIKCQELICNACSFNVYDATEGFICRNCC